MKTGYSWIIAIVVLLGLAALFSFITPVPNEIPGTSVDGLPIIDPSQQGQPTYYQSTPNDIVVTLPFPGAVTGKDFSVRGTARGYWFLEASFPVTVLDKDGAVLVQTHAEAQSDWMTEDFVPFRADVKAPVSYTGPATLILHNDNPSGDPIRDRSVSMPITIEY